MAMVSNITTFLFFVALFLSAPTSSTPVPISFLSGRAACPLPARFKIHGFQLFKNNTTSSLHFNYVDESNFRATLCSRFLIAGMAGSITDGSSQSCVDDHVVYTWNGTTLKVTETLDCDFSTVIIGYVSPQTFCYTTAPPYPLGVGTLCETPTGTVPGSFSETYAVGELEATSTVSSKN